MNEKTTNETFAKELSDAMTEAGLSIRATARLCGFSAPTVLNYLNPDHPTPHPYIQKGILSDIRKAAKRKR